MKTNENNNNYDEKTNLCFNDDRPLSGVGGGAACAPVA